MTKKGAEHGSDDAHAADEQGEHHHLGLERAVEEDGGEQHGGHHGDGVGFKEVGGHAGAVADVVAHVVGDDGGVAGVVFRNAGFHLAHEVGADVGALGEDAAAETGEDGNEGSAEGQGHEGLHDVFGGNAEDGEQSVVHGHAEQAEADHEHAGDGAGLEGNVQRGNHALFRSGGGAHVGAYGHVHADEAGEAGKHGSENEAESGEEGHGQKQQHGDNHAHDGDGAVLTLEVRLSAFLNGAGNTLHILIAGGGGEDVFGRLEGVVQRKGRTREDDYQRNESHTYPRQVG